MVRLVDTDGQMRAALGYMEIEKLGTGHVERRSPASLMLFNKKGVVTWKTP